MKSIDYDAFVRRTDQSAKKSPADRRSIAMYGLVGEIGSLVSSVKKKILAEGGEFAWDQPSEEVKEELGDVLWYCYSLAQIENSSHVDILANDIELLRREIVIDYRPGAGIRVSPHFYTTDEELRLALREIRTILDSGAHKAHAAAGGSGF